MWTPHYSSRLSHLVLILIVFFCSNTQVRFWKRHFNQDSGSIIRWGRHNEKIWFVNEATSKHGKLLTRREDCGRIYAKIIGEVEILLLAPTRSEWERLGRKEIFKETRSFSNITCDKFWSLLKVASLVRKRPLAAFCWLAVRQLPSSTHIVINHIAFLCKIDCFVIWCVTFGVFAHFQIYRTAVTISAMPHSQPPQNKKYWSTQSMQ